MMNNTDDEPTYIINETDGDNDNAGESDARSIRSSNRAHNYGTSYYYYYGSNGWNGQNCWSNRLQSPPH